VDSQPPLQVPNDSNEELIKMEDYEDDESVEDDDEEEYEDDVSWSADENRYLANDDKKAKQKNFKEKT